jgi:ribosome-associated protein
VGVHPSTAEPRILDPDPGGRAEPGPARRQARCGLKAGTAKVRRGKAIASQTRAKTAAKPVPANDRDALARSQQILALVRASLDDDKAEDVVAIELTGKSSIADYMVIATGRSHRQVGAMAEHLLEKLKAAGLKGVSVEGAARADWILIDGGDVIVHLFRPEVRAFYGLEKMWGAEFTAGAGAAAGPTAMA